MAHSHPTGLSRERSQDEVEVARQLIAHSQSAQTQLAPDTHVEKKIRLGSLSGSADAADVVPINGQSREGSVSVSMASPPPVSPTDTTMSSTVITPVNGQMCR